MSMDMFTKAGHTACDFQQDQCPAQLYVFNAAYRGQRSQCAAKDEPQLASPNVRTTENRVVVAFSDSFREVR